MAQQNLKVRSGNRIVPMIDGRPIGLIQSMRASDDYGPEAASGVGDIHAQEYVPSMARHTLTISRMVLNSSDLRAAGVVLENGDAALRGLVFDIAKIDKDTGQVLRTYVGCSMASGDVDVSKHTIVMASATYNALDVRGTGL